MGGGNSRERLSALLDFCGLAAAISEAGDAGEKLAVPASALPQPARLASRPERLVQAQRCQGRAGRWGGTVRRSSVLERPKQAESSSWHPWEGFPGQVPDGPVHPHPRCSPRHSGAGCPPVCQCGALLEKPLALLLRGHVHIFCWFFCRQCTWTTGILPAWGGAMFNCLRLCTEKRERWAVVCLL